MADWVTISSLATAGGTLVLAGATFAAVRSSNRSARIAELALQEQRAPVLVNARMDDPEQKVGFGDGHWTRVPGGSASVQEDGGALYLVMSVRNVGAGIAVLQSWHADSGTELPEGHAPLEEFQRQARDMFIAGGDVGLWQGAIRDPDDPARLPLLQAIKERRRFLIDVHYTDQLGAQGTITRFGVTPVGEDGWMTAAARHWFLERDGPR